MIEYSFRAWHKGEPPGCSQMLYENYSGEVFAWLHQGQPLRIMHFIGTCDKNEKKIYRCDIVCGYPYSGELIIGMIDMHLIMGIGLYNKSGKIVDEFNYMQRIFHWPDLCQLEVLGNPWENPELGFPIPEEG